MTFLVFSDAHQMNKITEMTKLSFLNSVLLNGVPNFIAPDQLHLWIKDQIIKFSAIFDLPLQLQSSGSGLIKVGIRSTYPLPSFM